MDLQLKKIELIKLLLNTRTESVLKKLRIILEKEQQISLTTEVYKIIDQRKASYLKGEGKSYTWEQVKNNAKSAGK